MSVEMIIDQWRPEQKKYRVETFCYGPKSCPLCRAYPHLQNDDFVFRLNQAFSNCSVCPIVFNVYEFLKDELWHDDDSDEFFDDNLMGIDLWDEDE